MKLKAILLLVVFSTAAFFSQAQKQYKHDFKSVKNDPLNTLIYTLDNGLKVYISVNKDEPRIQTNIAVNTGSKQDPSDATGLAHYLEHMLFKGTSKIATINWKEEKVLLQKISDTYEKRRSVTDKAERDQLYRVIDSLSGLAAQFAVPNEYDKMISSLGAKGTNAYTSLERTVYINDIPSNELEKWLVVESERFNELVLRLFHTELEAVYEEFNRSQDNDWFLSYHTMMKTIFKTHPYGTQSTIGTSEHLKNPSMEKIHAYFNEKYVANNMAIVLAGDIDPDKTIDLIEKYFGDYKSKTVAEFKFTPEAAITKPEIVDVKGSDAEWVDIAFRMPGIDQEEMYILPLMDGLLANGQAGLIDLDLVKAQKVIDAYSTYDINKDYSLFQLHAEPREGQSLEEAKDLLLEQLERIKKGDFEDWMLPAVIKNFKLDNQQANQYNSSRASKMTDAFIMHQDWSTIVAKNEKLSKLTKDDIVKFANKYFSDNYVVVNKRHGETENAKVEKPKITTVQLNRDTMSVFASNFEKLPSTRFTPVFDNYDDIVKSKLNNDIPFYYVKNTTNETFSLSYILDMGSYSDKEMALAVKYLQYLGTDKYSAGQLQTEMFKLGLSYSVYAAQERVYVSLSGLEESLTEGIKMFESILSNVKADQNAYDNMIAGVLKKRDNAKLSKGNIFYGGMLNYGKYGADSPIKNIIAKDDLKGLDINKLVEQIKSLTAYQHYVYYYGRKSPTDVAAILNKEHKTAKNLKPIVAAKQFKELATEKNKVYFVNYDMVQAEILMLSKSGSFNKDNAATINVFNEYFGAGLSSIVFQEIRESKALAYSAYSYYTSPRKLDKAHYVQAYVGTQVDKLNDATKALLELMNNMPEVTNQFEDSRLAAQKKIETSRTKRSSLFWKYLAAKEMGRDYDINKDIYPALKNMGMADLKAFFNKNIKGKKYTFLVIGNKELVDIELLKKMGEYKELTLEELFGY